MATRGPARDALHFAALSGQFIQNLMGCYAGYDVRYFAAALSRLPSPRPPDGITGLAGGGHPSFLHESPVEPS